MIAYLKGIHLLSERVHQRERGSIPWCTPAYDIFVVDTDGHITIKNPCKPYVKERG